jgi:hypothetical protein
MVVCFCKTIWKCHKCKNRLLVKAFSLVTNSFEDQFSSQLLCFSSQVSPMSLKRTKSGRCIQILQSRTECHLLQRCRGSRGAQANLARVPTSWRRCRICSSFMQSCYASHCHQLHRYGDRNNNNRTKSFPHSSFYFCS